MHLYGLVLAAVLVAGQLAAVLASASVEAAGSAAPQIRMTETSRVPACVTPERLMSFLITRNETLDTRYRDIARLYKGHGEQWRVRWDYAFFQMVIETNYLMYRRGDGRPGDVSPRQNNFAGIGTTGGGVPGDSYPDISTGVLAQIQHLVVYSGERIANPVGPRTRLAQDDILAESARVAARRPMTYQDLAGRWAVDRAYGRSIEAIAGRFREMFCNGQDERVAQAPAPARAVAAVVAPVPKPAARGNPVVATQPAATAARRDAGPRPGAATTPPVLLAPPRRIEPPAEQVAVTRCDVQLASYGGRKALLIRAVVGDEARYTALGMPDGREHELQETFIRTHTPGGVAVGAFATREEALERAYQLCPTAAQAPAAHASVN